jgi:hypothetical protein
VLHPRFHHLVAPDIPERLQLAALYAATSSLLPEPTSGLTGAQTALQLLRQCWHNGSLSDTQEEVRQAMVAQLQQVAALGGHLLPALHLMVDHLQISMGYLDAHLYSEQGVAPKPRYKVQGPCAAADAYRQQLEQQLPAGFPLHPYSQLTAAEEQELWQGRPQVGVTRRVPLWRSHRGLFTPLDQEVPTCPVSSSYVAECEQQLVCLVRRRPHIGRTPPYPLAPVGLGTDGAVLPLEKDMHNDLWLSWEVCHTEDQGMHVPPKVRSAVPRMLVSDERRPAAHIHNVRSNNVLLCTSSSSSSSAHFKQQQHTLQQQSMVKPGYRSMAACMQAFAMHAPVLPKADTSQPAALVRAQSHSSSPLFSQ